MKYLLAVSVLFSALSLADEDSLKKASYVSEVLGGDDLKKLIVQQIKQQTATLVEQRLKIVQKERQLLDEYLSKLETELVEKLDEPSFDQQLGQIYLNYYSEEELDQIIAFYQSPLGQKMRSQSPSLTKDVKQAISKKTEELKPKVRLMTSELKAKVEGWRSVP
ncbi:DUF2059 domain-containing protein [Aestuariibacter sp. GS-14]|uniref:DUF2059 domain-containing protein n=1 Tax=Aestuariibacter sp. GS-14 TaxID=2590670 RepID=UPI001129A56C|nr:DUF2059 domain-containing protein [Aestuariibacter sp. GS-14]TPV57368.1 DUF2059 domain-containing protein [Aestuariibacter sp. GS-14]